MHICVYYYRRKRFSFVVDNTDTHTHKHIDTRDTDKHIFTELCISYMRMNYDLASRKDRSV